MPVQPSCPRCAPPSPRPRAPHAPRRARAHPPCPSPRALGHPFAPSHNPVCVQNRADLGECFQTNRRRCSRPTDRLRICPVKFARFLCTDTPGDYDGPKVEAEPKSFLKPRRSSPVYLLLTDYDLAYVCSNSKLERISSNLYCSLLFYFL